MKGTGSSSLLYIPLVRSSRAELDLSRDDFICFVLITSRYNLTTARMYETVRMMEPTMIVKGHKQGDRIKSHDTRGPCFSGSDAPNQRRRSKT